MIVRKGRRGYFLACTGYPKCKNTGEVPANLVEQLGLDQGDRTAPPLPPMEDITTDLEVE